MAGTATIKCGRRRAFQYRHIFYVIGIDARNTVAQVEAAVCTGTAEIGIVQRYTVHYIKRLVVSGHFGTASQNNTRRTGRTTGSLADYQARHTSCHGVDEIRFFGFGQGFAFHFINAVAQRFALSLDAKGGNYHFIQCFGILFQGDAQRTSARFYFFGFITHVADNERSSRFYIQTEISIQIGNRSVGSSFLHYGSPNDGTCGIAHFSGYLVALLLNSLGTWFRCCIHLLETSRHPKGECSAKQ